MNRIKLRFTYTFLTCYHIEHFQCDPSQDRGTGLKYKCIF